MPKLKIINLIERAMRFKIRCEWVKNSYTMHKDRNYVLNASLTMCNIVDFCAKREKAKVVDWKWPSERVACEKVLNFKLRKWEMYQQISMNYYYYHYIKYAFARRTCPQTQIALQSVSCVIKVGICVPSMVLHSMKLRHKIIKQFRRFWWSALSDGFGGIVAFITLYWFWMISKWNSPPSLIFRQKTQWDNPIKILLFAISLQRSLRARWRCYFSSYIPARLIEAHLRLNTNSHLFVLISKRTVEWWWCFFLYLTKVVAR